MDKKLTIQAIAEKLSLSRSTVSKALNNYMEINTETRSRVLECASELGYVPRRKEAPRQEEDKALKRVGITVPGFTGDPIASSSMYHMLEGFRHYAISRRMEVMLLPMLTPKAQETPYDVYMQKHALDGTLLVDLSLHEPYMEQLLHTQYPTVLWDIFLDNPNVATVSYDSVRGAEMAVNYLLSLGHKRIGIINGSTESQVRYARMDGYLLALTKAGIPVRPEFAYEGDWTSESGAKGAEALYRAGVTAIFAVSDRMALSAVQRLEQMGVDVPGQVSVMGFDNSALCEIASPKLTSMHQDMTLIGKAACALLDCMFQKMPIRNATFESKVVARGSTGPCPQQK